jgi:hypothetical protein
VNLDAINEALIGAIAMATFTIGAFFLRFWKQGRDRFFLLFACSFFVEGLNRVGQAISDSPNEGAIARYGIRTISFVLILIAILDKNRARPADREGS